MMSNCPSRFQLVRLVAADLSDRETAELQQHVDGCDKCRASLAEIQGNTSTYAENADSHLLDLMDAVDGEPIPISRKRPSSARFVAPVVALAAAAAAAALILVGPFQTNESPDRGDQIAFKGSLAVEIVALRNGKQFPVAENSSLRADDALRFAVTSGQTGYLSIFSVTGDGTVSPFYPEGKDDAPLEIENPGRHEMPGSIVLDDATGIEYFVVLFSEEIFDRDALHEKLSRVETLKQRPDQLDGVRVKILAAHKEK